MYICEIVINHLFRISNSPQVWGIHNCCWFQRLLVSFILLLHMLWSFYGMQAHIFGDDLALFLDSGHPMLLLGTSQSRAWSTLDSGYTLVYLCTYNEAYICHGPWAFWVLIEASQRCTFIRGVSLWPLLTGVESRLSAWCQNDRGVRR